MNTNTTTINGLLFSALCLFAGISFAGNHDMMKQEGMMDKADMSMPMDKAHPMMKEDGMENMKSDMEMEKMEMKEKEDKMKKGM